MTEHKLPKAVLFDWDNTLADSWPGIHDALVQTFEHMGHEPWTLKQTKERVHRSMRDSFPEIFGERWEEAGKKYLEVYAALHLERLQMLQGAEEVLKHLQQQSIYMAVVSNKTGERLREEVSHIGWNPYFEKIVGSRDTDEDKPSTKPFFYALEGSGITPEEVWFVGDSISDLECAKNAQCISVFFGADDPTEERFAHAKPHHHTPDHDVFLELLQQISMDSNGKI